MKKILVAGIAAVALCGAAWAADVPMKAGPVAAPVVFNWTGFYFGGNVGTLTGREKGTLPSAAGFLFDSPLSQQLILGGQAGAQVQFGNFVLGVEGGYSHWDHWNSNNNTATCSNVFPCQVRLSSIWEAGGRLGWAMNNLLFYGTGGFAQGKIDARSAPGVEISSAWHNGSYIGGGIDYAVTPNLVLGVDYRHYNFDHKIQNTIAATNPAGVCPLFCVRNLSADADVFRARVSYLFGTR